MKHIVSMDSAALIDSGVQQNYGIPAIILMEQAGTALSELFFDKFCSASDSVVFLCGTGNNGGDAMVMARNAFFKGFSSIKVIITKESLRDIPAIQLDIIRSLGIDTYVWENDRSICEEICSKADWIVEGLLGIGQKSELRQDIKSIVSFINNLDDIRIFSIDVPAGIYDDYGLIADVTVNVGVYKQECFFPSYRKRCGDIHLVEISFPPELIKRQSSGLLIEDISVFSDELNISRYSHKGDRGRIGVFAGSAGMLGAALLSGKSVLRTPSGYVYLFVGNDIFEQIYPIAGPLVVKKESDLQSFDFMDSVLVGPGWGRCENRVLLLSSILKKFDKGVIDADAIYSLKLLIDKEDVSLGTGWVLTPHIGECAFLLNTTVDKLLKNPLICQDFVNRHSCTLVLKSHVTWIFSPGNIAVYDGCFSPLGTAGSGDVLAGLIAGLLTAYTSSFSAACAGVIAHANAAKLLYKDKGWFSSDMLVDYIGLSLKEIGIEIYERER
ncbi:NAD(P)H-hydrate dehydratase [Spirochaetia bacterium 38H-sp]|uniref:Bifunctional NAD(P)H-hydrate repair enzyme n=1 Tax=Rarispira pelagica TaxID=3141764 RepID=A0ABU9UD33_9SPIR